MFHCIALQRQSHSSSEAAQYHDVAICLTCSTHSHKALAHSSLAYRVPPQHGTTHHTGPDTEACMPQEHNERTPGDKKNSSAERSHIASTGKARLPCMHPTAAVTSSIVSAACEIACPTEHLQTGNVCVPRHSKLMQRSPGPPRCQPLAAVEAASWASHDWKDPADPRPPRRRNRCHCNMSLPPAARCCMLRAMPPARVLLDVGDRQHLC